MRGSAAAKGDIEVLFATTNSHKLDEANQIVSPYGISLKMAPIEKVEIQSETLDIIASHAARLAARAAGKAVVCEDSGLFVDALGGFPGPCSSYAFKTIGCGGLLKLMEGVADRRGRFESAVSYCEPGGVPLVFIGRAQGAISEEVRGSSGFGFDPVFIPAGGDGRTFAEMGMDEKGALSHRGQAFRKFALRLSAMAKLK